MTIVDRIRDASTLNQHKIIEDDLIEINWKKIGATKKKLLDNYRKNELIAHQTNNVYLND